MLVHGGILDLCGVMNIADGKLLDKKIDATLLCPPYSFKTGIEHIGRLVDIFGAYQAVVVNVIRSWIADEYIRKRKTLTQGCGRRMV